MDSFRLPGTISPYSLHLCVAYSLACSGNGELTPCRDGCLHDHAKPSPVKGSPYSITERRVPELIPVLDSQPAGDVSHKPGGRLPLLSARPAVTPATLKRPATNFAAW